MCRGGPDDGADEIIVGVRGRPTKAVMGFADSDDDDDDD
jgi:hypothetical protein